VATACLGAHHYLLGRAWVSCIIHSTSRAYSNSHLLQGIPVRDRPDLSGCLSEGDDVGGVTGRGFHKPERRWCWHGRGYGSSVGTIEEK
jgi:hypothetical protein